MGCASRGPSQEISSDPKCLSGETPIPEEFHPHCRAVEVSMHIQRVFDVDTVTQTFGVQVQLIFSWEMPDFESPPNDEMDDGDWVPEWTPKYRIKNLMENIDETQSFWNYTSDDDVKRIMLEANHVVRVFEQMELERFPVDCQDLSLQIEMRQTVRDIQLVPSTDPGIDPFFLHTESCFLNDFRLLKTPCVFGLYNTKARLGKSKYDRKSSYGKSSCGVKIKIHREATYYISNVIVVLMIIATFTLAAWAMHPGDIDGRLSVDFQLILTAVAFKLVLNGMTPTVSYFTVLDYYVLGCFAFLSAVTIYHSGFPHWYGVYMQDNSPLTHPPEAWARGDEDDMVRLDKYFFVAMSGSWLLFNLAYFTFFTRCMRSTRQAFQSEARTATARSNDAMERLVRASVRTQQNKANKATAARIASEIDLEMKEKLGGTATKLLSALDAVADTEASAAASTPVSRSTMKSYPIEDGDGKK